MVRRSGFLRPAAAASVLTLGALSLAVSATAEGVAVPNRSAPSTVGVMTPAVSASPRYHRAGTTHGSDAVFPCQTATPASCYGPRQVRHAYGVDKLGRRGINGRGTTIVIVDAFQAPAIRHDLHNFNAAFGLPRARLRIIAPQGLTPFDPADGGQVGWSSEISLDVEWAHAIAPRARIDLVLARSDDDADIERALAYVAAHRLGNVVSQSYGEAEQCLAVSALGEHRIFARMVAHGTTVFASTLDTGAAQSSCDGTSWVKAASTPASDPLVTGVGGTALFADGSTGAYHYETVWNEPGFGAGGSGRSSVFHEPAFQRRVQHTGHRAVPDVAYNAAGAEGVLVAWSSSGAGSDMFFTVGGTSSGSPQWAGLVALANQVAHHRLGDINPVLYRLGASRAYRHLFHDVTRGNTSVTLPDAAGNAVSISGASAHRGWDFATGFGSPRADILVPALAGARD
jgi:subtilase family serine protease